MKLRKALLLGLAMGSLMLGASCVKRSGGKKKETAAKTEASEKSDEEVIDQLDQLEDEDLFAVEESDLVDENANEMTLTNTEPMNEPMIETSRVKPMMKGATEYQVSRGDTLMMVAYNMYGDYRLWKSIAQMNGISGSTPLSAGMVLQLDSSLVNPPQAPGGAPYMIQGGDTLSKIAIKQYGDMKQWRPLWKHNDQLIKDPNLIFAGFQMYLLPDQSVAFIE